MRFQSTDQQYILNKQPTSKKINQNKYWPHYVVAVVRLLLQFLRQFNSTKVRPSEKASEISYSASEILNLESLAGINVIR